MGINKIVITGGPCAGKSEAVTRVRNTFKDKLLMVCECNAPEENGEISVSLRDSYDAVFFMESAAIGAPEHYIQDGTRLETLEEAVLADRRLLSCWVGAPHLRVIPCRDKFEDKLDDLCAEIAFFLGEPEPLEIERKFLIEYPDIAWLESDPLCHGVEISQSYIDDENGGFRVRKRGERGDYLYFLTRKQRISDSRRIEIENRITEEEYLNYINSAAGRVVTVSKTRYCLIHENKYFEVDVFPFWDDRALLEIELKNEDETFTLPPQFRVIREVTSEREYTNKAIARTVTGLQS